MRILIIDPVGGISGDMLLGSLVHLGCPVDYLRSVMKALPVGGFTLSSSPRSVGGIAALDLSFGCGHEHGHRTYAFIRDTVLAPLPAAVRDRAGRIFLKLAEAEAAVHGVPADDVHFHEVGALDSILDIVGIAAAVEYFSIRSVYCREVPLGSGTTRSMHGIIPLPAPATVRLLQGRKVRFTDIAFELATPTGAAAIAALAEEEGPPPDLTLQGVGYGCGDREIPGWPNYCRCLLCETASGEPSRRMYLVEADVDDMNPEDTEAALERLFDAGALDGHLVPKIMKRGRPGFCFEAVCPSERLEAVMGCLLTHTTSIGARCHPVERRVLERTSYTIGTRWGEVGVKESVLPDGSVRSKPEYRDLERISGQTGLPVAAVRAEAERLVREGAPRGSLTPVQEPREETSGGKQ